MNEETKLNIAIVCKHCFEHNNSNVSLEINFRDEMIYYICAKCKKKNQMSFKQQGTQPYPRTKTMR